MSSLSDFEYQDEPQRIRKIRVLDRKNPFDILDDHEFKQRYRLNKATLMDLVHRFGNVLEPRSHRNKSLPPLAQILITLRFYVTGAFRQLFGDDINIHESSACRAIKKVTDKIASLSQQYISMPQPAEELRDVKAGFYNICGFPRVTGAIDCTHI